MKIGYPCINLAVPCKSNRTFRLKSYSEARLVETVENNLECLGRILRYNVDHAILFFRITSDLVPFASHAICQFNWQKRFKDKLREIGHFIRRHSIRISMHPDQFTLINTPDLQVLERSRRELLYHVEVLDLMELDYEAKVQIHVGGVYGDKENSMARFIQRFKMLDTAIQRRLVIENDDRHYTVQDCLRVHAKTEIPVIFDTFHHELTSCGETVSEALHRCACTWKQEDGIPMVDYSSQQRSSRRGTHAATIDLAHFVQFLQESAPQDFDVMLEIKNKEESALGAIQVSSDDPRFVGDAKISNTDGG